MKRHTSRTTLLSLRQAQQMGVLHAEAVVVSVETSEGVSRSRDEVHASWASSPCCQLSLALNSEGMSLQQIGDMFGMSRERVRQIQESGLSKLRGSAPEHVTEPLNPRRATGKKHLPPRALVPKAAVDRAWKKLGLPKQNFNSGGFGAARSLTGRPRAAKKEQS